MRNCTVGASPVPTAIMQVRVRQVYWSVKKCCHMLPGSEI